MRQIRIISFARLLDGLASGEDANPQVGTTIRDKADGMQCFSQVLG